MGNNIKFNIKSIEVNTYIKEIEKIIDINRFI